MAPLIFLLSSAAYILWYYVGKSQKEQIITIQLHEFNTIPMEMLTYFLYFFSYIILHSGIVSTIFCPAFEYN